MISLMTRIAKDWAVRCFGADHVADRRVRAQRFLEEALELVQASGLSCDDAASVVEMVYAKPAGNVFQETGGTMLTLAIFLDLVGVDPEVAMESELRRVLAKTPEHFKRRNDEKVEMLK